jgi:inner membrane protein
MVSAVVQVDVETNMCHLILVLPVIGLVVFWIWPMHVAAAVYATILLVSLSLYYLIMRAMQRPVVTGAEEILQGTGKVIEVREQEVRVRVHSEIWNAESPDKLCTGDQVRIVGVDGLVLSVRRMERANGIAPFISTVAGSGMSHKIC